MAFHIGNASIADSGAYYYINKSLKRNNVPAFHAYRDAGHITAAGQVVFNKEFFDNNNDYNTSTGYFTAPIDGLYWFYVWSMDSNSSTQYTNDYIELQKNNSDADLNELRIYTSAAQATRSHRSGGKVQYMNANDTMRVYNQTATLYGTSYLYLNFMGCLIQT